METFAAVLALSMVCTAILKVIDFLHRKQFEKKYREAIKTIASKTEK